VPNLEKIDEETTKLIESVVPAVVSIDTKRLRTQKYLVPGFYGWEQRFSRSIDPGQGSGVIVSPDGYVVTNEHVIRGADEIEITLHDKSKTIATLIGADPIADIAVLKIQEGKQTEFACLPLADSDKVRVGQQIWAIGTPFGLSETVTYGHISHRDRQLGDGDLPKFQHDAVLEPGNSGGPLINARGQVVGINNMIWNVRDSAEASWQGISFAIPSNVVRRSMDRIVNADGKRATGYLGIFLDTEVNRRTRESRTSVTGVAPGSPAAKAGLKEGDVLKSFGGRPVTSSSEVFDLISERLVGEPVDIQILRQDKPMTIKATVEDRAKAINADALMTEQKDLQDQVGIVVRDLTPNLRQRYGLREGDPGILIEKVLEGSEAEAHFYKWDMILQVNGQAINSVQEFYETMQQAKSGDGKMTVQLWRRGQMVTPLTITLPKDK
jgi:serine protease Do